MIICGAPGCGKTPPPSVGSRPRKYCDAACKSRAYRLRGGKGSAVADLPAVSLPKPGGVTLASVVRRDLQAADRLDTFAGQQATELAETILAAGTTASSKATLMKVLSTVMAEALAGAVPRVPDRLDELEARRAAKVASA